MNRIKMLVMDVDGTLTDGKIYMTNNGEFCKAFNIKDGLGINRIAIPAGITPVIITGRNSEIVAKRCYELGINKIYQGVENKVEILNCLTENLACIAYIGDDINDLECMNLIRKAGGLVGCPYDAVKLVKESADFVSRYNGGEGAVRDFIEWILKKLDL